MSSTRNLLARLRSNMSPLSKKMRQVAEYVLEHASEVQSMTITDLAHATQASEATVVRFCRDMGYKGYSDFRIALAVDLSNAGATPQACEGDICERAAQGVIENVQDTASIIDRKVLGRVTELLHKAVYIGCVGVGSSSVVGHYLAYRLTRVGKKAVMYEDTHLASMNAVRSNDQELWLVVSSSGSTKEVNHVATLAHEKGAKVISLTNLNYSPLSSVATEMLVAARSNSAVAEGGLGSKVGQLLLVDIVLQALQEAYPEYREVQEQTAQAVMPLMIG